MNTDQMQGKFDQFAGRLKYAWGRLTDDEIALYEGRHEEFYGKLQEIYGLAREEAERHIKELEETFLNTHAV